MTTFVCPKCGTAMDQPSFVLQVCHPCQGRVRELRRVDTPPVAEKSRISHRPAIEGVRCAEVLVEKTWTKKSRTGPTPEPVPQGRLF